MTLSAAVTLTLVFGLALSWLGLIADLHRQHVRETKADDDLCQRLLSLARTAGESQ